MAAIVKTKLKAAREAFTQKDYERAQQASAEVLEYEPDNYNAYVLCYRGALKHAFVPCLGTCSWVSPC